jgi:hypothetical protein
MNDRRRPSKIIPMLTIAAVVGAAIWLALILFVVLVWWTA